MDSVFSRNVWIRYVIYQNSKGLTYIEEKIKWLNDHNIEYFQGECGGISINMSDIPKELSDEYHKFSYALQKKYEEMEKNDLMKLEKERLAWSLKTMPEASALSSLIKFFEEIKEVRENVIHQKKDPSEYADCLMCLFDSAGRDGITAEMIYPNAKSIDDTTEFFDRNILNYFDGIFLKTTIIKENIKNGDIRPHFYTEVIAQLLLIARIDGIKEDDLIRAFKDKFEINKNRIWVKNPDNTYSHVKN